MPFVRKLKKSEFFINFIWIFKIGKYNAFFYSWNSIFKNV